MMIELIGGPAAGTVVDAEELARNNEASEDRLTVWVDHPNGWLEYGRRDVNEAEAYYQKADDWPPRPGIGRQHDEGEELF